MDKELLTHLERIAKGIEANASTDQRALAADTLRKMGLDHPELSSEEHVKSMFEYDVNEASGAVHINEYEYEAADVLRKMDPIAYKEDLRNYTDSYYVESNVHSDCYYSREDLDELRDNASSVFSDVQSHLLKDMDEDTEDYALIDDAKNFDSLLKNCHSLHSKAEIQKEVAPWQAPARSTAAVEEDDTASQRQHRTRRM